MVDVQIGEQVVVTFGQRGLSAQRGEVVKVGRVWIEVQPDGSRPGHAYRFRLDTQTDGSQYASSSRFYTLDQWAERERQNDASKFLSDQGIRIDFGSAWRGREVELVNLIRSALEGR